jgi:hypothetical protein
MIDVRLTIEYIIALFLTVSEPSSSSNYLDEAINNFKGMCSSGEHHIFNSANSLKVLHSMSPDIISYTALLTKLYGDLHNDRIIHSSMLQQQALSVEVSMHDFFTHKGMYIDTWSAIITFRDICIDVLTICNKLEKLDDKSPTADHNLRVTSGIVSNIIIISKTMII